MYRLKQVLWALLGSFRPVNYGAAEEMLSPPLVRLFQRMHRAEQLHSLRMMEVLQSRGYSDPDLLTAALLHDCGKSRYPFTLPERVLVVMVKKLAPAVFERWSAGEPLGWRRMFVISARHPKWSAEDMERAGASSRAAALARRHQERISRVVTDEDQLLLALQTADDDN